ncbi:hypothetical protein SAMD00079811_66450 [Scytonema sp. HK-05]|uniref:hypothetical protein n=1 Tax=Scytonema sp. HK-05 TaxID=1137095 RepID=UPI000B61B543|nr:hypothetical protein [Scytonema sp. HK-05]BAY49016.1 hypothetical protein SAMD00079811_66450 [Scytonema sp. HK-05]
MIAGIRIQNKSENLGRTYPLPLILNRIVCTYTQVDGEIHKTHNQQSLLPSYD